MLCVCVCVCVCMCMWCACANGVLWKNVRAAAHQPKREMVVAVVALLLLSTIRLLVKLELLAS